MGHLSSRVQWIRSHWELKRWRSGWKGNNEAGKLPGGRRGPDICSWQGGALDSCWETGQEPGPSPWTYPTRLYLLSLFGTWRTSTHLPNLSLLSCIEIHFINSLHYKQLPPAPMVNLLLKNMKTTKSPGAKGTAFVITCRLNSLFSYHC